MTTPEPSDKFKALLGGPPPETLLSLAALAEWLAAIKPAYGVERLTNKAIELLLKEPQVTVYILPAGDEAKPLGRDATVQVGSRIVPAGYTALGIAQQRRIPEVKPERQHHLEHWASKFPALYAVLKLDAKSLFGWEPVAEAPQIASPTPLVSCGEEGQDWTAERLARQRDEQKPTNRKWLDQLERDSGMKRRTIQRMLSKHDNPKTGGLNWLSPASKKTGIKR